jgi:hypothetical protein
MKKLSFASSPPLGRRSLPTLPPIGEREGIRSFKSLDFDSVCASGPLHFDLTEPMETGRHSRGHRRRSTPSLQVAHPVKDDPSSHHFNEKRGSSVSLSPSLRVLTRSFESKDLAAIVSRAADQLRPTPSKSSSIPPISFDPQSRSRSFVGQSPCRQTLDRPSRLSQFPVRRPSVARIGSRSPSPPGTYLGARALQGPIPRATAARACAAIADAALERRRSQDRNCHALRGIGVRPEISILPPAVVLPRLQSMSRIRFEGSAKASSTTAGKDFDLQRATSENSLSETRRPSDDMS